MLNHLDLFSGIGGFSLGLEATGGFKTTGFCEIDPFCQQVLKKHWPDVPIYNDVRGLEHDGRIDIITGGYPCQPFSTAGKRKGKSDPRHLWPAMFGIIEAKRPRWVIGENVAGHISMGLDEVLADLERGAYSAIPFIIPACAVGAPHRRDRIWIVAWDTESQRTPPQRGVSGGQDANALRVCGDVPDTERDGCGRGGYDWRRITEEGFWRAVEPPVCGMDDGIPYGLDSGGEPAPKTKAAMHAHRIKALGNSVVPQIPYMIGKYILETEKKMLTPSP